MRGERISVGVDVDCDAAENSSRVGLIASGSRPHLLITGMVTCVIVYLLFLSC